MGIAARDFPSAAPASSRGGDVNVGRLHGCSSRVHAFEEQDAPNGAISELGPNVRLLDGEEYGT